MKKALLTILLLSSLVFACTNEKKFISLNPRDYSDTVINPSVISLANFKYKNQYISIHPFKDTLYDYMNETKLEFINYQNICFIFSDCNYCNLRKNDDLFPKELFDVFYLGNLIFSAMPDRDISFFKCIFLSKDFIYICSHNSDAIYQDPIAKHFEKLFILNKSNPFKNGEIGFENETIDSIYQIQTNLMISTSKVELSKNLLGYYTNKILTKLPKNHYLKMESKFLYKLDSNCRIIKRNQIMK